MSSTIWTRGALSSEARFASGRCWRMVEAQHQVSTAKLTDNLQEQERLEALLDESKPAVPAECRHLNYLLSTPFRYGAAYPRGSRFRRAGFTPGVFYAAEQPRTAAVEMAFHRLLFFAESPKTPWPANPGEYTAFAADYAASRAIDLRAPPFDATPDAWTHPTDYEPCQSIAEACREDGIDAIKYRSARAGRCRLRGTPRRAIRSCPPTWRSCAAARSRWRTRWSGRPGGFRLEGMARGCSASFRGRRTSTGGRCLRGMRGSGGWFGSGERSGLCRRHGPKGN
jgi:hypothetical protein